MRIYAALTFITFFVSPCGLFAQHSYLPSDIEDGRRIYESSCGTCHGAFGDAVPAIDLGRGLFRRAKTDEDLVRIIRSGIRDTSMPPFNFTEAQTTMVVAYLRNMTATPLDRNAPIEALGPPGDAIRGRVIFEGKGNCLSCHWSNGAGNITGPDLSAIGGGRGRRSPAELRRSLLEPNAEVRAENRTMRVVTKLGATSTGNLLNQDTDTIQLRDPKLGLASFRKADLKEFELVPSPMPSSKGVLTDQESADVVTYLLSLKGTAP